MRLSYHSSLGNRGVSNKGTLHLGCADTMSANIQDIVHTTRDEMVSIFIANNRVSREVVTRVWLEVHGQISFVISQTRAGHSRPRLTNCHDSLHVVALQHVSIDRIQDNSINPIERKGTAPRFHRGDRRDIRDDMSTRFGLPIRVNNGALLFSHNLVVPPPCLGIDRFSYSPKNLETTGIVLAGDFISETHQKPNGSWRRIESVDLVTLHHIPITTRIWIYWCRFKHEGRSSNKQRAINNVCMSCDPSTVRNASKNVALFQIECGGCGEGSIQSVPTNCMEKPLGFSG
mmetsp:Transcript_9690/g.16182  ORF Transcript_9690/g.16182 Transcript_9690/m.16182 type:complete len:288 (-) Transcript_9690:603-1466(-)